MPLAAENVIREQGMENSVEIYFRKIEEILLHITGHRIYRERLCRHGVYESCHANLDHFEKGISYRKFP